jgi:hypothetical protein
MTASLATAPANALASTAPTLVWTSPETKLWVATLSGEFAGYVEFTAGHFAVTDATGHPRPPHATLRAAQASLAPVPTPTDAAPYAEVNATDADAAATAFAVAAREPAASTRAAASARVAESARAAAASPTLTRALAATAIALAGAAVATLAVALNVLTL